MGKIVLLDELTINQIAAGEVIERPASVVKEMVENSIDAGATNVTVEIKNGGISYIRITDNGKGIEKEDLEIAFERHATSKIRSAEDLDTVTSMGFRGEALASIAAIANVELVSKTQKQDTGYKVVVEAGDVLEKEETGCPNGTTITVRNLFFNTPVRYKFLKKDYTESGYIEDVITRLALVNPNIAFKLINTGKTIIQTTGNGDKKSIIYSIYGKEIAEGIEEVNYEFEDVKINGVVGKPEIARSNRSRQLFFVNDRYVKDKTLSSAADKAFKGMLPIGKFGFLVLNIHINPSKVDVNVHPAKLEVRFEEESKIFKAVFHSIQDTLLKTELVANAERPKEHTENTKRIEVVSNVEINEKPKVGLLGKNKEEREEGQIFSKKEEPKQAKHIETQNILEQLNKMKQEIEEEIKDSVSKKKVNKAENKEENIKIDERENNEEIKNEVEEAKTTNENEISQEVINKKEEQLKEIEEKIETINQDKEMPKEDFKAMYEKTFGRKLVEEKEDKNNADADVLKDVNISLFEETEEYKKPKYKFIGIAFRTYIILEMNQDMYILDQHAAHERIMYEKVKKNYYQDEQKNSQLLLLPDIITLTHKEMDIAKDNMAMFEKAGFMLEEFGENTIKLSGVPDICIDLETKDLFLETLDEINTVARTAKQEIEDKFLATVACKAAVKANMALSEVEVDSLMEQLLKLPNPFTCPHGRPTAIKMSKYDIERKFSRK